MHVIFRYDGQRAQIHKLADGTVRVFSRNGDETTLKFPDLVDTINESCKPAAHTFILDAEVRLSNSKMPFNSLRLGFLSIFLWLFFQA